MHKVFVYGSLLSGMGNHILLSKSKLLGTCKSPAGFKMIDLGWYPGVIPDEEGKGTVIGEVYEVSPVTMIRLDGLEGYNPKAPDRGLYNRIEIDTDFGKAMIYIYNWTRPTNVIVKDGNWREHFNNK